MTTLLPTPSDSKPVHVYSMEDLQALVRQSPLEVPEFGSYSPLPEPTIKDAPPASSGPERAMVSREEAAFLRRAAADGDACLEDRWRKLGVKSGSVKRRLLRHLTSLGLIRVERAGSGCVVRLYDEAYEHLYPSAGKGHGAGGGLHRLYVADLASRFRSKGCDVRIEFPVGPAKKRVDLVAFGRQRIGIEIGLHPNKSAHEVHNLAEDLRSGALDLVLFCSPYPSLIQKVQAPAQKDPVLAPRLRDLRFYRLELELPEIVTKEET